MKHYLSLVFAAVIVGFTCFAVEYWIFNLSYREAMRSGIILAITGFIVESLKPWLTARWKKNKLS